MNPDYVYRQEKVSVINNLCQQLKWTFELCMPRVIFPPIFCDNFKEFQLASRFYIS